MLPAGLHAGRDRPSSSGAHSTRIKPLCAELYVSASPLSRLAQHLELFADDKDYRYYLDSYKKIYLIDLKS